MRIAVACALFAGCSSTPTVAIQLATQPSTISFRPERGEWTTVTQLAQSQRAALYELPEVDGTIAVACKRPDGTFQVEELFATAADLTNELYASLAPWPQLECTTEPDGPSLVELTGTMLQGGQVFIGEQESMGDGPWTFHSAVTPGVHDLVAVGQSSALIRHDQPIATPYTEPIVDLNQGLDLGSLTVEDEFCDGFSTLETDLTTVNGTHAVLRTADSVSETALYFPSELLETGDIQVVIAVEPPDVFGDEADYSVVAVLDPNQPDLPLVIPIEPPVGATFGSDDVSVDFFGASIDAPVTEYRVEYSTQAGSLAATATAAWIAAHQAQVVFDPTFPGFRWPIGAASEHAFTVAARGSGGGIVTETTLLDP